MQTSRFLWLWSGLALFMCMSGCQRDEPLPPRSEWTTRVAGEVLAADGTPVQGVIAIETGRRSRSPSVHG